MSFLNDVLNIFIKYYPQLLTGVGNTLLIALTSTAAGLALGLLTGVVRTAPMSKNPVLRALHKLLNAIIAIYVEIFRGTPMMVQSMVIYWGYAFATGGSTLPLIPSGILIVSINTGAYMAEIVRGGILSVDRGQFEGAQAIGMRHGQTMRGFGPGCPYHIPEARKAGQHPHRRIRQPQPQVSGGFRLGHNGTVRQHPTRLRLHSLHVAMRGQPANADAVCRGNICRLRANRAG